MQVVVYSEDQRDCLQEICNVAMGEAGAALAEHTGEFVTLSIPAINIIDAADFAAILSQYQTEDCIYAATQLFASSCHGPDLAGLGMIVLADGSMRDLRELSSGTLSDQDLIIGACRCLVQTCLDALSEQWGLGFRCQPPELISNDSLSVVCESLTAPWQQVLIVKIHYLLEGREFKGDLLLLFPDQAINAMAERLDELLA